MEKLRDFVNERQVKIIIDDKNKIYICDYSGSYIDFIIDLNENILYVDRMILDIFPERDFNALFREVGVEIDILPYFDEIGDIKAIKVSQKQEQKILMDRVDTIRFRNYRDKWEICFDEGKNCLVKYVFVDELEFVDYLIFEVGDIYHDLVDMLNENLKLFRFWGEEYNKYHLMDW